jgi:excisionase family DNA binding protein
MTPDEISTIKDIILSALNEETRSPWFTCAQAAKYASVSRSTLYEAVNAGVLKSYKTGFPVKVVRFHREDLDAWLKGKTKKEHHV